MEMNEKQKQIIEALKNDGMNRMAEHVAEQFAKGFTYDEVWAALTLSADLFKDIAWSNRSTGNL